MREFKRKEKMNKNADPSRARNLALAAVAAQAGCWTLFLIFVALLLGLWLDSQFQVRGLFTIGLLLLSVPISLFAMVRVALRSVKQIQPQPKNIERQPKSHIEEG